MQVRRCQSLASLASPDSPDSLAANHLPFTRLIPVLFLLLVAACTPMPNVLQPTERYVSIGDSYTIGTGVTEEEAWPALLAKHLRRDGIDIELVANPAQNGWTSADAKGELPIYDRSNPTFATLFIGVNDQVRGVPVETFHENLAFLIDHMLEPLPSPDRLVLFTIPDYSVTPVGGQFESGRDLPAGRQDTLAELAVFNEIIREEAKRVGAQVVDFHTIAVAMQRDPALIASDGLHPSAAGHAYWEALLYPVAREILVPKH